MNDDTLIGLFEEHFLAIETDDDRRYVLDGLKAVAAEAFQEGMEALALATLPGQPQPVNPYKN